MVALGALEIGFIVLVAFTTGATGLFAIYVLLNQFRNTGRRPSRKGR